MFLDDLRNLLRVKALQLRHESPSSLQPNVWDDKEAKIIFLNVKIYGYENDNEELLESLISYKNQLTSDSIFLTPQQLKAVESEFKNVQEQFEVVIKKQGEGAKFFIYGTQDSGKKIFYVPILF